MNRISPDARLAIALISLLFVITFISALNSDTSEQPPAYASNSSRPDGTLALTRWLDKVGYDVSNRVGFEFKPPDNAALIAILEPSEEITEEEWNKLDQWVSDGGTLLLAGDRFWMGQAASHYLFNLRFFETQQNNQTIQEPLLISPPIPSGAQVRASAYFVTNRTDYVTHMAAQGKPIILSFKRAKGRVILNSAPYPLSNLGLKDEANPPLALNLMTATSRAGQIWFDEWHHGQRVVTNSGPGGPEVWLTTSFGGRALLYAALAIFVGLLLQGRAFGKPLPLTRERARRTPLEYITAIANLNRRAGHRRALLDDYHFRLKRDLGRRYRLSPSLDDAEFARLLGTYRPDLNAQDLLALLTRLKRNVANENEVVDLTARVAAWLEERPGKSH